MNTAKLKPALAAYQEKPSYTRHNADQLADAVASAGKLTEALSDALARYRAEPNSTTAGQLVDAVNHQVQSAPATTKRKKRNA